MDKTGEEKIEKSPWYKATANDMDWRKKVDLIGRAQKEIDHSISNTINLPKTATVEIIDQIYRRAWKAGCKGLTVYRDGCKEGVLINSSLEEKTRAEKLQERPTSVPCDIYHIKVRGKIFNIAVGIINDKPYEIFAGAELEIDKGAKSGVIKKVNKGDYRISINGDGEVKIKNAEITVEEAALTRIISVGLRNNIDIEPMLHQLEKGKGDFGSFEKALVRVLKKYVKDGTEVKGEQCPECGGTTTLKRIEGCVTCSCGWSKC
jgi:ribonucleoside-diphosphate reductase alpha chain